MFYSPSALKILISVKFCRTFPQRKSVICFLYGPDWANIDKIKFTMAQGRLEFEVAFQSLDITNTWSCDIYLMATDEYIAWKILLHKQMRSGKYIIQNFLLFQSLFLVCFGLFSFFPLSALIFKRLIDRKCGFPSQEWTILRITMSGPNWILIHACVSSKPWTISDSGLWFRCICLMKITYLRVSLKFHRPKRLQRDK